jgi:monofunctional biosynthetic peptidoglycan transglycosylase
MLARRKRSKAVGIWRKLAATLVGMLLGLLLISIAVTLPLRWIDPPTSAYMWLDSERYQREIQYQWRDYADISDELKLAVIAAEDQSFPQHAGFDWTQIRAAVKQHQQGAQLRGASTLSQQVARNLYLWQGNSAFDKWLRKGLEAWLTFWLELTLPKQRILAIYLNVAELAPAIYGAEAASQHYYGVAASGLSRAQAVALAAVLPTPGIYSPLQVTDWQRQRRQWISAQMQQLGGIGWLRSAGL